MHVLGWDWTTGCNWSCIECFLVNNEQPAIIYVSLSNYLVSSCWQWMEHRFIIASIVILEQIKLSLL